MHCSEWQVTVKFLFNRHNPCCGQSDIESLVWHSSVLCELFVLTKKRHLNLVTHKKRLLPAQTLLPRTHLNLCDFLNVESTCLTRLLWPCTVFVNAEYLRSLAEYGKVAYVLSIIMISILGRAWKFSQRSWLIHLSARAKALLIAFIVLSIAIPSCVRHAICIDVKMIVSDRLAFPMSFETLLDNRQFEPLLYWTGHSREDYVIQSQSEMTFISGCSALSQLSGTFLSDLYASHEHHDS